MAEITSLELKVKTNAADAAEELKILTGVLANLKTACSGYSKKINAVSGALERLTNSSRNARTAISGVAEAVEEAEEKIEPKTGNVGGETAAKRNWIEAIKGAASKATPALKTIGKVASVAGKGMQAIGKGASYAAKFTKFLAQKTGIAGFANNIKRAADRVGILSKQLIRIATYRAIRAVLKDISQSFKTGATNAYAWAQSVGNSFAPSMDRAATSLLYMKNSLGAMVMPLANALVPVLETIIDKFVEMINKANQFFATITGASTWTKALKYPTKFAEETAKAGNSLRRSLLGFDELNRLDADNGSGSSAEDATEMFTEVLNGGGFGSAIRELFQSQQWTELGTLLANKINEVVNSIDVKKIATNICSKLNDVMTLVNSFLSTVDWEGIGAKVADGFNAIAETLDPNALGQLLSQKLNIVVGLIKGFVENFKWGEAGIWLANVVTSWFDSIKWDDLMVAIAKTINGLFEFARNFITNIDWEEKATHLADTINGLVDLIDWENIGGTINDFVNNLLDGAITFFEKVDWVKVGQRIYDALSQINFWEIFTKLAKLIWSAIKSMFQVLGELSPKNEDELLSGKKGGYAGPFADGGIPTQGSLFWAGEAGPELVGQVGGHSSVINANQFAEGMAYANDGVINAVLAIGDAIVNAVNNVDVNPQLDGMALARGLSPYSKRVTTLAGNSLVNG